MARRKLVKRSFSEIERGPLGGAVFEARKRLNMTQAQLAESIGRDRPWLSDVETGKVTHVPEDDLAQLAEKLDLDVEALAAARDRMEAKFAPSPVFGEAGSGFVRICPSCRYLGAADARFCANCGIQIPADVTCPSCGRLSPATANFCSRCGSRLR